jgi:uncharacterized membrane protein YhhN
VRRRPIWRNTVTVLLTAVFAVTCGAAVNSLDGPFDQTARMLWTVTGWGSFTLTRFWLAATLRLPWPLMSFLADAHQRQVLRQVGAVYQFRHIDLQHHLARNRTLTFRPADRPAPARTGK